MSELPEGWQFASLGEIGSVQSGVGFPNEHQGLTSGDYPVYKVGDVSRGVTQNNGKLQSANNFVSAEIAKLLKGQVFEAGSTLFAKIGEALKLNRRGFVIRPGLADNNVMGYKSLQGINDRFIYYFLRTQDFAEYSRSTTVPSIRKGDIEEIKIALSPSSEQTRIAQKLDELLAQVDTIKARIDAIRALLKRFRQSILSAAVSGRLTQEWRGGVADFHLTTVGKVCSVSTGKTPKRDIAKYWDDGDIPWLTSALTGSKFCTEAEQFVTESALKECTLKLFQPGTLLMAMYGEGKTRGQVTELKIAATCNQACAAINVDETLVKKDFVKIRLQENYEEIRKQAVGGAQPNLNLEKVREITISLPSLDEQTEIVRRVEQLFAFTDQLEAKIQTAQARVNHLTQSILAKAFRGELVSQDPNDEPASELLSRIKAQRAAAPKAKRGRKVKVGSSS